MMSTATTQAITAVPAPFEVPGPVLRVPSLKELERLTEIPEQRVVFRGVDWAFFEQLVESIPASSNIQVAFDGKDLEVMGKGRKHGKATGLLGQLVEAVAQELGIPYSSVADTTWKRPGIARGLEADRCYYFLPSKIAADSAALERGSTDIADYPNPDVAVEVDISTPQIDRPGIYAALQVTELWRFDGEHVVIERLGPDDKFLAVDASGFLPIRTEDVERWVVREPSGDESSWARRLRAEIRARSGAA